MLKFFEKLDVGWPEKNLPPKAHYYILWPSGIMQHVCWRDRSTNGWHTPNGIAIAGVGENPPWGGEISGTQFLVFFCDAILSPPKAIPSPPLVPHDDTLLVGASGSGRLPIEWNNHCPTGDELDGSLELMRRGG